MEPGAQKLYNRAIHRLAPEEAALERSRDIPYPLSLNAMAQYFWRTGTEQGWLSDGGEKRRGRASNETPLLLAVSGGGDSAAMLWMFRTLYDGPLIVAHVNHGIRDISDEDAAFVKQRAETWGTPYVERKVSVPEERARGESLETAARRVRHRELVSLADSTGAWGIATGHNRDDLAETALFNILRGTGPRGGVGITGQNGRFLRPMLGLRREFLRELLRVRGLSWREDETNSDTSLTRNFIRLELLPLIEERVNAGAVEHLADFAASLSLWREDEERRGKALLEAAFQDGDDGRDAPVPGQSHGGGAFASAGGGLTLSRKAVAALSPLERSLVIREAGRRLELPTLSRRRVDEFSALIVRQKQFTFQWARGVDVLGKFGVIRWGKPRQNGRA
ncbi:MAG: tRNA lysidine(34) synthetase TilS [Fretibacterium sp.]|nr:tRNA lysidine(34) synthetase TilS [Fretibacterium sp.]